MTIRVSNSYRTLIKLISNSYRTLIKLISNSIRTLFNLYSNSLDKESPQRVFSKESRNIGICYGECLLRILRIIGFKPQTWLGLGGLQWRRIPKFLDSLEMWNISLKSKGTTVPRNPIILKSVETLFL